jgi:chaperonin GroEL
MIVKNVDMCDKILEACEIMSSTVGATFGPNSGLVLLNNGSDKPFLTKDGVTVAANIEHQDPAVDSVLKILLQACEKTAEQAGDGTTTTSILATKALMEYYQSRGELNNPFLVVRHLKEILKFVKGYIEEHLKVEVDTFEKIEKVAMTSTNGDEELSAIIRECFERVGVDGNFTIEAKLGEPYVRETVGYEYNAGYNSRNYVRHQESSTLKFEDAIVLTVGRILGRDDVEGGLVTAMEFASRSDKPLVVIAHDFDQAITSMFVNAMLQGKIKCCTIKAAEFGEDQESFLKDLSVITGAYLFDHLSTKKLAEVTYEDFGHVEQALIGVSSSTFIGSSAEEEDIDKYVEKLKDFYTGEEDGYLKEVIQKRIGRLESHSVFLNAGGSTQQEIIERSHRLEDALLASLEARTHGVVPGSGVSYYRISQAIEKKYGGEVDRDLILALKILKSSLLEPISRLISTSGCGKVSSLLEYIRDDSEWTGVDLKSEWPNIEKCNLLDVGVVDSKRTCEAAIENAVSVCATLVACAGGVMTDRNSTLNEDLRHRH